MTCLRFAVIGAGRLGASLALALRAKGLQCLGYSADTPAGRARAEAWLGGSALSTLPQMAALQADLYLVTVPDSALPDVAHRFGDLLAPPAAPLVIHTSGGTSVRVLAPCADAGATTLALHPLQTFADPLTASDRFAGAGMAVTPGPGERLDVAEASGLALARLLEAHPFLLPDESRSLYHAAATMACNYFVTLEHLAADLFVRSGLPAEHAVALFLPLVTATLENISTRGTLLALTGPLSRGDLETVRGHLAALEDEAPGLLVLYRELALATLDMVRGRDEIDERKIAELTELLEPPAPAAKTTSHRKCD